MTKNKIIMTMMIGLLLFLSASLVSAFIEDFQINGERNINVDECVMTEKSIAVVNTGDISSSYVLRASGSGAKFLYFGPTSFVLEPGESKEVLTNYRVPCGKEGNYKLEIGVSTALNKKKLFRQITKCS